MGPTSASDLRHRMFSLLGFSLFSDKVTAVKYIDTLSDLRSPLPVTPPVNLSISCYTHVSSCQ